MLLALAAAIVVGYRRDESSAAAVAMVTAILQHDRSEKMKERAKEESVNEVSNCVGVPR